MSVPGLHQALRCQSCHSHPTQVVQLYRQGWVGLPQLMILVFDTGPPLQEKGPLVAAHKSIHLEALALLKQYLISLDTVQVEMCSIPEHVSSKVRSLITDKSTVGGILGNPLAIETLGGCQQLSALIFFLG